MTAPLLHQPACFIASDAGRLFANRQDPAGPSGSKPVLEAMTIRAPASR